MAAPPQRCIVIRKEPGTVILSKHITADTNWWEPRGPSMWTHGPFPRMYTVTMIHENGHESYHPGSKVIS